MRHGLRGGQGREPVEIEAAGRALMVCVVTLIFVAILTMCGCVQTYHERDGQLRPNRPSAKELRESLGVF